MSSTATTQLETNAAAPRRVQGDTGSVEQHSLPDQIAADKHIANKKAGRNKAAALAGGMLTVVPAGAD